MLALLTATLLVTAPCGTPAPHPASPRHFVFIGRDRDRLADSTLLRLPAFAGAQVTYTWRELEPAPDAYDFAALRDDLARLRRYGKRLFIQLQDVSFSERVLVPEYLRTDPRYSGGAERKYEANASGGDRFDGWIARRWDPAVLERFARLLDALGREFDGEIEGIVLPETSTEFRVPPAGFTPESYAAGIRANVNAARAAFRRSCVIIYANFMPGESLPDEDRGFLRGVHTHAAAGAAMAVQDGNLADIDPATGAPITVAALHAYAVDVLRLDYIFWGTEEPYFSRDVVPFLRDRESQTRRR